MFEEQISFISSCISLMGVAIIVYSALKSVYLFLARSARLLHRQGSDTIRVWLWHYSSLEFMVAADIIESIVKPTFS